MKTTIGRKALIQTAYDLDPLPANATRLAQLVAAEDPDLDEIIETVSLDLALTADTLRYANSAALAPRHNIDTVRAAVVRLGIGAVVSLAVASCMRRRLDLCLPPYDMDTGELWQHSIVSALTTEGVARSSAVEVPPATFTAALLHDIGKLVIARAVDPDLSARMRGMIEAGTSQLEVEDELFELDHAHLGGMIAEHWGLPGPIVAGIEHHHAPGAGRAAICDAVHLANAVAKIVPLLSNDALPVDGGDLDIGADVAEGVLDRLGIAGEPALSGIADHARRRLDEVIAHLG